MIEVDEGWSGRPSLTRRLGVSKVGTRAVLSVLVC